MAIGDHNLVTLKCDQCGAYLENDTSIYWSSIEKVIEFAEDDGWQFPPDRDVPDLCPDCVIKHGGTPTRPKDQK